MPIFHLEGTEVVVFYAHVPKTGGTYIEDLFRENGYRVHLWKGRPHEIGLSTPPQHYHRALFENLVSFDTFAGSFLTVRNPIDRFLSEYRNQLQRGLTVQEWATYVERNIGNNPSMHHNHLRPQVDFLHPKLDVFRQEDGFGVDWAGSISDRWNLGFSSLECEQRRDTSSTAPELDPSDLERVIEMCAKLYAADFNEFGYTPEASRAVLRSQGSVG